jgi:hypothetical protein
MSLDGLNGCNGYLRVPQSTRSNALHPRCRQMRRLLDVRMVSGTSALTAKLTAFPIPCDRQNASAADAPQLAASKRRSLKSISAQKLTAHAGATYQAVDVGSPVHDVAADGKALTIERR